MAYTRIKASGIGAFPIDMLRFLQAWPATQTDAAAIQASAQDAGWWWQAMKRHGIEIMCASEPGEHSLARFRSFGWEAGVADIEHGLDARTESNRLEAEARERLHPHPGMNEAAVEDARRFAEGTSLERAVQHRAETRGR